MLLNPARGLNLVRGTGMKGIVEPIAKPRAGGASSDASYKPDGEQTHTSCTYAENDTQRHSAARSGPTGNGAATLFSDHAATVFRPGFIDFIATGRNPKDRKDRATTAEELGRTRHSARHLEVGAKSTRDDRFIGISGRLAARNGLLRTLQHGVKATSGEAILNTVTKVKRYSRTKVLAKPDA